MDFAEKYISESTFEVHQASEGLYFITCLWKGKFYFTSWNVILDDCFSVDPVIEDEIEYKEFCNFIKETLIEKTLDNSE